MQSIVVPPMWKLIEQGIIFSEKIPHFDPRARNSAVRDIAKYHQAPKEQASM
jgi:hypothetical protein